MAGRRCGRPHFKTIESPEPRLRGSTYRQSSVSTDSVSIPPSRNALVTINFFSMVTRSSRYERERGAQGAYLMAVPHRQVRKRRQGKGLRMSARFPADERADEIVIAMTDPVGARDS